MPSPADDFLKAVMRSGLLSRELLQATLSGVPREHRDDPHFLADFLIKAGKLTRFQGFKLLQGAWFGLQLGPFQVEAPIGRGGMGAVYLAFDLRSHRHVALKVLPPKRAKEEDRHLARFRREMEMSQRVRHPNIALTLEAGESQGVHYIVMEYIPGRSLHRLVGMEGVLAVPRAARLFAEVAAALEHAHLQGLVHRDLKPSNILITPNVHAKVLDLGLALRTGEVGDASVVGGQGYVVGSMDYIAPEQTEDASKVDGRADLYSMGCTLYYALAGRPPFPGGTNKEKIRRHRHERPEPLLQFNPRVSEEFANLVEKMLAKDPERRFASAAAVREVLLPWAGADRELPFDQPSDPAYQQAVAALTADVTADMAKEAIVIPEAGDAEPAATSSESIWLILALVGFWAVLLLILGLVLLLR